MRRAGRERTMGSPDIADCGVCKVLKGKLEAMRAKLYDALEEANMEQGHPKVLQASIAFDHVLNQHLRHQHQHVAPGGSHRYTKRLVVG